MTIGLAIPPLTVKNRGDALIRERALNGANTVQGKGIPVALWLTMPGSQV